MLETVLSIALGLALAANCGLRAFMPLFIAGLLGRVFDDTIDLSDKFEWLSSTPALITLGVAVIAEVVADKVPAIDHILDVIQTPVRTIAGIIAFAAVMGDMPAWITALSAVVVGGGVALSVHATKAAVRAGSTVTTAGTANPLLSLLEDFICLVGSVLAIVFAIAAGFIAGVVLIFVGGALVFFYRRFKTKKAAKAAPTSPVPDAQDDSGRGQPEA